MSGDDASRKKILLTGGAGYIGSHTAVVLMEAGYDVVLLDNLSNGNRGAIAALEKITGHTIPFVEGDVRDEKFLEHVFSAHSFHGIIHFAALKSVDESIERRDEYFEVNVTGTQTLCAIAARHGVKNFVYSSSAAVYGDNARPPMNENTALAPTTPYGETKVACEKFLETLAARDATHPSDAPAVWRICMLRYFNPIGAHTSGLLGEHPRKAANLCAIILEVLRNVRNELVIYGDDYATPDGTCIRDYIHVMDLARAHVAALIYTATHGGAHVFNVGTGTGVSVKEMVAEFERQLGKKISTRIGPRRAGDAAFVVADVSLAARELGWRAQYGLFEMVRDTLHWFTKNPRGFEN